MAGKQKIAIFELEDWEKDYFKKNLKEFSLTLFDEPLSDKNVSKISDVDAVVVFIHSGVNKDILAKLKKIKLVATMSTGFDHIDTAFCKEKGITVCTVPFYGENTVAEHAFGLVLALSRKICLASEKTKRGDFSLDGLRGFDLKDKTIGIVGMGHIGMNMARMAKGFGMNVVAFDVHQDPNLASAIGFTYIEKVDDVLAISDVISLHAPYNKFTHHLINKDNIKKIKKGAILVNTARGGLIDTESLVKALDNGTLSGAGLDVLEGEDIVKEEKQLLYQGCVDTEKLRTVMGNNILIKRDNVIVTPHSAFNSQEALVRILETTVQNVNAFYAGKQLNVVK